MQHRGQLPARPPGRRDHAPAAQGRPQRQSAEGQRRHQRDQRRPTLGNVGGAQPGVADEDGGDQQAERMDEGAGRGVDRDRAHGRRPVHPGLLEVANVQSDAAEAGRGEPVGEGAGHLHERGPPQGERRVDGAELGDGGREVACGREQQTDRHPVPAGRLERAHRLAQLADLGQQQVNGEPGGHQEQQGAEANAGERFQRWRLGPAGRRRLLAQLGEQAGPGLEVGAGGRGQGGRLQQRQRLGDRLGPECPDRGPHRPVGADQAGQRDEQLGHVAGQPPGAGRGLGEPEVEQPRQPAQVDQYVGATQVAVGDAGGAQPPDLGPDLDQEPVVDVPGVQAVKRPAGDVLLDQQGMALLGGGGRQHRRGADPGAGGQQPEIGLVLDRLLGGRERGLVLDSPERRPAPQLVEQVGVALLTADRLDEPPLPVARPDDEGDGTAGVRCRRVDRHRLDPGRAQAVP